jgi:adsorption protein B
LDSFLYILGLVLVLLFIIGNFDDLIWDLVTLVKRLKRRDPSQLDLRQLDAALPKSLAIAIPVWNEGDVLFEAVDDMVQTIHYPQSMYHIFLGVYSNDTKSVKAARELATRHINVHVVLNAEQGPTSKADNLNSLIKHMRSYEEIQCAAFGGLIIHDSEDIVHPYELKVTNYLLDQHPALQFPVFPLQEMPRPGNYFKNLTVGTYADEFAEKCYSTMINRYYTGAFVPSVGAGFVLSRSIFGALDNHDLFARDDMSSGYQLSLSLLKQRIYVYYVLERVQRLRSEGKLVSEFIATRTRFPSQVGIAIRQRTRSIFGTTMQSFAFRDIFTLEQSTFGQRYSLYRDQKAKWNNVLIFLGYVILLTFVLGMLLPLPPVFPLGSLSWLLCFVVAVLVFEKQLHRAVALANIYGYKSAFIACFLPPIFSIRAIWGSVINLIATLRAWGYGFQMLWQNTRKTQAKGYCKAADWGRSEHELITERVLQRFHRNLGDVLLEKGSVTSEELGLALRETQNSRQTIGNYLLKNGSITEEQLLSALAHIKHVQYLEISDPQNFIQPDLGRHFKREQLEELLVVPLLKTDTGFVFAFSDSSPYNAQSILREQLGITVNAVLATQDKIETALRYMYDVPPRPTRYAYIFKQYEAGKINYEQTIIAFNYLQATGWTEEEVLKHMGLDLNNQREHLQQLEQGDSLFDELITATIETLRNES